MQELQITKIVPESKGRVCIRFENGTEMTLYRGEIRSFSQTEGSLLLTEGAYIPIELYEKALSVVTIRAKKRALFLLEQMDRTEQQLKEKLKKNGYPEACIEAAVSYVIEFHYIDDLRYAEHYIRYHQQKKSRQKLKMDLMQKGVAKDTIEQALEEFFDSDERRKILALLEKRHYDAACDRKEQQRTYQFLMRRGFKSSDILSVMRCNEEYC